jgi:hypothetical protein
MSKRLEVLLDEEELAEIQRAAERERVPLSDWVLAALRERRRREAGSGVQEKLAAVRRAAEHSFPVGDAEDMLAEIESGYLDGGR